MGCGSWVVVGVIPVSVSGACSSQGASLQPLYHHNLMLKDLRIHATLSLCYSPHLVGWGVVRAWFQVRWVSAWSNEHLLITPWY